MNAGLANLDTLKKHLLASSLTGEVRFDALIADIGLGVARALERHCARQFLRTADATYICSADRDRCYVDRYPIESISKVELKTDETTGWEEQTNFTINRNDPIGLVYWGACIGYEWSELRFTFTGGYFWEIAEPDDATYPTAQPVAATALPDDLRLAWLLQCRHVWDSVDKTGSGLIDKPGAQSAIATLKLVPAVEGMIAPYRRMALI